MVSSCPRSCPRCDASPWAARRSRPAASPISVRMTGCPNGCARPYLGDVGLVGTTLGKYDVFLGGDPAGTRLNWLYAAAVPLGSICDLLSPLLHAYRAEGGGGEAFGDWCDRAGAEQLQQRCEPLGAAMAVGGQ